MTLPDDTTNVVIIQKLTSGTSAQRGHCTNSF